MTQLLGDVPYTTSEEIALARPPRHVPKGILARLKWAVLEVSLLFYSTATCVMNQVSSNSEIDARDKSFDLGI